MHFISNLAILVIKLCDQIYPIVDQVYLDLKIRTTLARELYRRAYKRFKLDLRFVSTVLWGHFRVISVFIHSLSCIIFAYVHDTVPEVVGDINRQFGKYWATFYDV